MTNAASDIAHPPRVFISYGRETQALAGRVKDFAHTLIHYGVSVTLDQFDKSPDADFVQWYGYQLEQERSDFVLVVNSAAYRKRIESGGPAESHGSQPSEGVLLRRALAIERPDSARFIPILFDEEPETSIPSALRSRQYCRVRTFTLEDPGYSQLLQALKTPPSAASSSPEVQVWVPSIPSEAAASPPSTVSERVRAAMDTLIGGTEDDRETLLADIHSRFDATQQAELKAVLLSALGQGFMQQDYRLRDPRTSQTLRGWFVGALALLEPFDSRSQDTLSELAQSDDSEWVRYWSLAHLYWRGLSGRGLDIVAREIALKANDSRDLAAALAVAIGLKRQLRFSEVSAAQRLKTHDERELWIWLRAFQIVGFPELARDLVALLPEQPTEAITYDVLLALTGPEMGDAGYIALRDGLPHEHIVQLLLPSCRGATDTKVRRFAKILHWLDESAAQFLRKQTEPGANDPETARRLAQAADISPATPLALEPGPERAEFAYRAVLEQPARYEILDTLDPVALGEAVRAVAGEGPASLADILPPLRAKDPEPPHPLWTAWIDVVHAAKLQQH